METKGRSCVAKRAGMYGEATGKSESARRQEGYGVQVCSRQQSLVVIKQG